MEIERDKVVNDYLKKLTEEDKSNPNPNPQPNPNEIDLDDFAKAEASYRKSLNKKCMNNSLSIKLDFQNVLTKNILIMPKIFTSPRTSNLITLRKPEKLYMKENINMKRFQLQMIKYKTRDHISLSTLRPHLTCIISPKKNQEDILLKKKKVALNSLNDSRNPYSKKWVNGILIRRYDSQIEVNGFKSGIPQLKLIKIKGNDSINDDNKKRKIEYPYILRHFI